MKIHGVLRRLSNSWSLGGKKQPNFRKELPLLMEDQIAVSCCIFFDEEVIFSAVWS